MTGRSAVTAVVTIMVLAGCAGSARDSADQSDGGRTQGTSGNDVHREASDHPDYSAWDRIERADYQGFIWEPLLLYTDGKQTRTYLKFRADGTYIGSDGCNGQFGTYTLWPNGDLAVDPGPQTLIGCVGVNINNALQISDHVRIEDRHRLTLYDGTRVVLVLTASSPHLSACCPRPSSIR